MGGFEFFIEIRAILTKFKRIQLLLLNSNSDKDNCDFKHQTGD